MFTPDAPASLVSLSEHTSQAVASHVVPAVMSPAGNFSIAALPWQTQTVLLCFGSIFIVYAWVELRTQLHRRRKGSVQKTEADPDADASVDRTLQLLRNGAALAAIITFVFIMQHAPPFPHASKVKTPTMYLVAFGGFFLVGLLTIRKSASSEMLHREQTDEWRGWMQFLFLMYHYLHASEMYLWGHNCVSAYVWMTGFGNALYFYLKDDYSFTRVLQMLFRINFVALLFVAALDNTYVLYYVCPLHSFWFLVSYGVMAVGHRFNYRKHVMQLKIMGLMVAIFVIYDLFQGSVFSAVFFWLPQAPILGAANGSLYEWYYRSGLDRFSCVLGMVFAWNMPFGNYWMNKVERMPTHYHLAVKGALIAIVSLVVAVWWNSIIQLPKLTYNTKHPYFVWIPICAYCFLRNSFAVFRSYHSEWLRRFGKFTLESYLLHHHIWLSSNAKTILTLVPGYPTVNMVVTFAMCMILADVLFTVSVNLKCLLIPGDVHKQWHGVTAMLALGAIGSVGAALCTSTVNFAIVSVTMGLALCAAVTFLRLEPIAKDKQVDDVVMPADGLALEESSENTGKTARWTARSIASATSIGCLLVAGGVRAQMILTAAHSEDMGTSLLVKPASVSPSLSSISSLHSLSLVEVDSSSVASVEGGSSRCSEHAAAGKWVAGVWAWNDAPLHCHVRAVLPQEAQKMTDATPVTLMGDVHAQSFYEALTRTMGGPREGIPKDQLIGTSKVHMRKANNLKELLDQLQHLPKSAEGMVLLEALPASAPGKEAEEMAQLASYIRTMRQKEAVLSWKGAGGVIFVWITMPSQPVVSALASAKGGVMELMDEVIQADRFAVQAPSLAHATQAEAQALFVLLRSTPKYASWRPVDMKIGNSCNPWLGAVVLLAAAVMLFTMDNTWGVGHLLLVGASGQRLHWESVYGRIHKAYNLPAPQPFLGEEPKEESLPLKSEPAQTQV